MRESGRLFYNLGTMTLYTVPKATSSKERNSKTPLPDDLEYRGHGSQLHRKVPYHLDPKDTSSRRKMD